MMHMYEPRQFVVFHLQCLAHGMPWSRFFCRLNFLMCLFSASKCTYNKSKFRMKNGVEFLLSYVACVRSIAIRLAGKKFSSRPLSLFSSDFPPPSSRKLNSLSQPCAHQCKIGTDHTHLATVSFPVRHKSGQI